MKHICHWPTCKIEVVPALWGCGEHWFRLPMRFRRLIWKHYRAGQEIDKQPSKQYVAVALEVRNWIIGYLKESK